uniref:NAC domain-containing protein n=1 Tax=Tanacetum cinerariifolium TaxID=118510 RepID=A0A6L2K449_TANCI|nr:hypothetical protein [Tanacetum cinerariifolium]
MLINVAIFGHRPGSTCGSASLAIKGKNQHLVFTERSPSQKGIGFTRIVARCIGGHWTLNRYSDVIQDPVSLEAGYCREHVFYKEGVNTHWIMQEIYTSDKVKRASIIYTITLKTGREKARPLKMSKRKCVIFFP